MAALAESAPQPRETGGNIIEVRDLVTRYGDITVLDGVSCEVRQGEIFVIIGGSGSGKTTLLKHMCGLLQPAEGEIIYNGEDITKMDEEELAVM
jgi:phospholipid/cholesterol/gamma-HCH transport system ATP-binding protein